MITIPITATPNQSFSIVLDGSRYDLTLKECAGGMVATIVRDSVTLVDSMRCVAGAPLLPYIYQMAGNFIFTTTAGELPYYDQFGDTQSLVYLTAEEVAAA